MMISIEMIAMMMTMMMIRIKIMMMIMVVVIMRNIVSHYIFKPGSGIDLEMIDPLSKKCCNHGCLLELTLTFSQSFICC